MPLYKGLKEKRFRWKKLEEVVVMNAKNAGLKRQGREIYQSDSFEGFKGSETRFVDGIACLISEEVAA